MLNTTQSITFVDIEFVKRASVEEQDAYTDGVAGQNDCGNKYQSTVEPRHVQQLRMIADIFGISKMFMETEGWGFTGKELWDALPLFTTVMTKPGDNDIVEDQEPEDAVLVIDMIGGVLPTDGTDDGNIVTEIVGRDLNDAPGVVDGPEFFSP
jgi:hypothetical protein